MRPTILRANLPGFAGSTHENTGISSRWLKLLLHRKNQDQVRILEIGSWAGASAITWAEAIKKLGRSGRVTCVDLWQPYFDLTVEQESHYREMSEAAKENKIFNLFLHNIRAANVSDMIDYLIGNARDVLPKLPSENSILFT